jgi:hypothetical protein
MGYTSYWKGDTTCADNVWAICLDELREVIKAAGIPLAGGHGTGQPVLDMVHICFNGKGEASHETFMISRGKIEFEFCKTAQKPYDIVVCAALIILNHHIPTLIVSSDGDGEDWKEAIELCKQTLGYGVYPCGREEMPTADSVEAKIDSKFQAMSDEAMNTHIQVGRIRPEEE